MLRTFASLGLVSLMLVACGDSSGTGGSAAGGNAATGGGGANAGGSGAGTGTGGAGGEASCELPTPQPGTAAFVPVNTVDATAADETGLPIGGEALQLCGLNGCLYETTSAIGTATFTNSLSSETIDRPLFKPGNSIKYGKIGYLYDPAAPSPLKGVFPKMADSGQAMAAGQTVSSAGVELTVPAGGVVDVDDLIYDTAAKQTFRAAQVPEAQVPDVTGSPEFAMVFALGPVDTLFCPPAAVTFENYAGLAAGTDVEIWGQELDVKESFGGYGEWAKIADGKVSADGATIETTGAGLPVLLTVAIKPI